MESKPDTKSPEAKAAQKANDSKKPQHAPDNYSIAIDGDPIEVKALHPMKLSDGSEVAEGDTFEASKQWAHDLVRHGHGVFTDDSEDVQEKDDATGEIKIVRRKKTRGK